MTESYELIIITYRDASQIGESLRFLQDRVNAHKAQVITAAAVSKDISGKTSVDSTLKITRKRGTRYAALAGGFLALLGPAAGLAGVLAGAAAGGYVGHKIFDKSREDFATAFLDNVLDQMEGGSSALVILATQQKADQVAEVLRGRGGEIIRQPLPQEEVDRLLQGGYEDEERLVEAPGANEESIVRIKSMVQAGTRRIGPHFECIFVIVNPASGKDESILNKLNSVFRATNLDWDVAITKKAGDAARLARQAAENGYDAVAVYGGDGSVMEAASGLIGSDVPLAILPGGTNNVMSVELGIPKDLIEAAALIGALPASIRAVDMGRANDHTFILRVGVGYEAVINETADREMKDRLGGFAYSLAGLKALKNPPIARYRLTLDGRVEELDGLWCMIANSASLGAPNLTLVHDISVSDGLLDVIIVRQADLDSLLSVVSSVTNYERLGKPLPHWQVGEVIIEAEPQQAVTGDGEIWEPTPLKIEVIPQAVNILVPA